MKKRFVPATKVPRENTQERGVTMILVAVAMVAIIAMAALSIDVVTLYLAKEEAQHSADAAALGAAKTLSLSGITGDPTNQSGNWGLICGPDDGTNGLAARVAKAIATQSTIGGNIPSTINVTYSAGSASTSAGVADCASISNPTLFGINPVVTVQVIRSSVPSFFSRIWGSAGTQVSATASAEVFNSSNSASVGTSGTITPVQPRCMKPWIVPNWDPLNPVSAGTFCTGTNCKSFVSLADGSIVNPGMSINGGLIGGVPATTGVIGERFTIVPDCSTGNTASCTPSTTGIQANSPGSGGAIPPPPNLEYLPGQTLYASSSVPSAASGGNFYQQAVAGCDQTTVYYCGVPSASPVGNGPNMVDLGVNPVDDTTDGVTALIHESNAFSNSQPTGQDTLGPYSTPFDSPTAYPFQIFPGSRNPTGLANTTPITASNSIVSLPIFDPTGNTFPPPPPPISAPVPVTIVGFLQVFINAVDQYGNVDVTVLNVAGCGNGATTPVGAAISANSPVPVRLITPP
jgi:Flp pilus assembly protein TadG